VIPKEFLKEKRGIVLTMPVNFILDNSINHLIQTNKFYGLELEAILDELTLGQIYVENFYEILKIKVYHKSFSIVLEGEVYPEYIINDI